MRMLWLQRLLWPGLVLAGITLAAFLWAVWPVSAAPPDAARRPPVFGPAPVPSGLEQSAGYVQESPEQLGAEPLPGAELTPERPPVVR